MNPTNEKAATGMGVPMAATESGKKIFASLVSFPLLSAVNIIQHGDREIQIILKRKGEFPMSNVKVNNIPSYLKTLKRWCVWRYEYRDGRKTKVPFNAATGWKAKSNDPTTWTDFPTAWKAYTAGNYDGLMFALGDGITGVDIDHCFRDGKLNAIAEGFARRYRSYAEISPSGNGLHILVMGKLPEGAGHRTHITSDKTVELEIYDTGRFFTVTGDHWGDYFEVNARQEEIDRTAEYIKSMKESHISYRAPVKARLELSDREVVERMLLHSSRAYDLYICGDLSAYGGDHSRADLALMSKICFFTYGNPAQMERIFSSSVLGQRKKWRERYDYRQRTIAKALGTWTGK